MAVPVTVAIYIDRGEAIRAGHNKWDWQSTEIDLETLDIGLRETLSRCPEKDGVLLITHSDKRPGSEGYEKRGYSAIFTRSAECDSFNLEREDMPSLIEATPVTALQMIEHLASLSDRLKKRGANLFSDAERRAGLRETQSLQQAHRYVAALDSWLSANPDELVVDLGEEHGFQPSRFRREDAPIPPVLESLEDQQIAYDLEEAQRLIDGKRPRLLSARPGADDFDHLGRWDVEKLVPQHLAAAKSILVREQETRAHLVMQHKQAIAASAYSAFQALSDAKRKMAQEEQRIAAIASLKVSEAQHHAADNQAVRNWATRYGNVELLALLDQHADARLIIDELRRLVFHPLARFSIFRKIRKQDLLIANPNLAKLALGLGAVFNDEEDDFTDATHKAEVQLIVQAVVNANIPAQFNLRLHRGRLASREQTIGASLEARSLLVTAGFGNLKISRAFTIGRMAPVEP